MPDIIRDILAIVGVLASLLAFFFGSAKMIRSSRKASWRTIKKGVLNICTWLQVVDFEPDAIIGIGRSGGVVASLVAMNMRKTPPKCLFGIIDRRFVMKEKEVQQVIIFDNLEMDLKGKRVLLIDIALYTGRTMREVTQHLDQKRQVGDIRTVVVFKHQPSIFQTDFNAFPLKSPIEMPWEWTSARKHARKLVEQRVWHDN